jgi:apolipoprotein N-acyltransferase
MLPVQTERAVAVALVGFAFALAYPRRLWMVGLLVLGSTVLLELLQLVVATRHGRLDDALAKALGGIVGIGLGRLVNRWSPRR